MLKNLKHLGNAWDKWQSPPESGSWGGGEQPRPSQTLCRALALLGGLQGTGGAGAGGAPQAPCAQLPGTGRAQPGCLLWPPALKGPG